MNKYIEDQPARAGKNRETTVAAMLFMTTANFGV
jgi:hypothetical protein